MLPGVRRVTLPAPGVGHVHCYLLRGPGGWTLVDTGPGTPGAEGAWREVIAGLDAPLQRVVITHMHVDHLGAAADVAPLAAGPVLQAPLDRAQADAVYGDGSWPRSLRDHATTHGMPPGEAAAVEASWQELAALARPAPSRAIEPGERIDGWEVVALPGHADGHIGLLRDGVLVAGDALLADISPNIGAWPGCDPDPLALYTGTLRRIAQLAPRIALPGHGDPVADPAGRARATAAHHAARLEQAAAALGPVPRSAYEVSRDLWPADLDPGQRSFALAEALAHLRRLVAEGRAEAVPAGGLTRFRTPAAPRPARA